MGDNGEVKIEQIPDIIKNKSESKLEKWFTSHKRLSMGIGMVCTSLLSVGLSFIAPEVRQKEKKIEIPTKKSEILIIPERKASLDEIISRHCEIEEIINPAGEGNVYLIGMQHNTPVRRGENEFRIYSSRNVPYVQTDIYYLLKDLVGEKGLSTIFTEGLRGEELAVTAEEIEAKGLQNLGSDLDDREKSLEFFRTTPFATAPVLIEVIYADEVRIFGVDDKKEMDQIQEVLNKRADLEDQYRNVRRDSVSDEEAKNVFEYAEALNHRLSIIRDIRSLIFLKDSESKADGLGESDYAIVIGGNHLRKIREKYDGKRKMYVIWPKSLNKEKLTVR